MMDEYPNNSLKHKANLSEKKVEKVVRGKVKVKNKSEMHKFKDIFISEDAANVKSYILLDVLVPAVKKAIKDIVTDGIEIILYGESGRRRNGSSTNASYVSYNRFADRRDDDRYNDRQARVGYSYKNITLETRGEAEEVLSRMDELIDTYGVVSVADLYDLVGITGNYTDNKYGWTNIRNAKPVRVGDGFMLELPKALPIN